MKWQPWQIVHDWQGLQYQNQRESLEKGQFWAGNVSGVQILGCVPPAHTDRLDPCHLEGPFQSHPLNQCAQSGHAWPLELSNTLKIRFLVMFVRPRGFLFGELCPPVVKAGRVSNINSHGPGTGECGTNSLARTSNTAEERGAQCGLIVSSSDQEPCGVASAIFPLAKTH